MSPDSLQQIGQFLLGAILNGRKVPIDLERAAFGENNQTDLSHALEAITSKLALRNKPATDNIKRQSLPNVITFPYSRHSSYPELCNFVRAFRPRDVWPCTVDAHGWVCGGLYSS